MTTITKNVSKASTTKTATKSKLTIKAKQNIADMTAKSDKLKASKLSTDHNIAKYIDKCLALCSDEAMNLVSSYDIKLVDVKRNVYGKVLHVAQSIVNGKPCSRDHFEQSNYMYDALFNVFTKSKWNDGTKLTFSAGDIGARMGTINELGEFKGMKGNTQPYAVMKALELFTLEKKQTVKSLGWAGSKLTVKADSKFGKAFFKLLDNMQDKELETTNKGKPASNSLTGGLQIVNA